MPRASVSTPTVLIPSPRKNQSAPMKVGDSTITVPPGGTSSRAASAMPCEAPLVIMMLSGPTSSPSVVAGPVSQEAPQRFGAGDGAVLEGLGVVGGHQAGGGLGQFVVGKALRVGEAVGQADQAGPLHGPAGPQRILLHRLRDGAVVGFQAHGCES